MPETPPKENNDSLRVTNLYTEIKGVLGEKKANEIIRLIQETTREKLGKNASIRLVEMEDIEDIITKLLEKGIFGIVRTELMKVDEYLNKSRLKRQVMLRFFKHYIEPEEYKAILVSLELVDIIHNKYAKVYRSKMIAGLYERIEKFRYGRRILIQVSIGRLEGITYPRMRALELQMSDAGRIIGPKAEEIKQMFYSSIKSDPTKIFVRRDADVAEIFENIATHLFSKEDKIPYLDVYSAKTAREVAKEAIDTFLDTYLEYESEEHPETNNPEVGYTRIKHKE